MNKRLQVMLVCLSLFLSLLPSFSLAQEMLLVLSDEGVTLNDQPVGESGDVYLSHDIIYYEDRDAYDSGLPYGEGTDSEKHSAQEAAAHTLVNITAPGVYRVSGRMSQGQLCIDLGEDAETDPSAVVTLILDNLDITCTVAPAILFREVYECGGGWTVETATSQVDTSLAGANVILADGSVNTVTGSHVARIYKDEEGEKKKVKFDGAFYSCMSMNIGAEEEGTGVLTIHADNEGLNSELHLTMNGGNVRIFSQDDGINTNEDNVSVTTINGGDLHIIAGLGAEGDGIDSNGWLVINGGTVISSANPAADAGLDSDMGSYVNGGTVVALGSTMDWAESDSEQVTMNLQFASYNNSGDAIVIQNADGSYVFAYDPSEDEVVGSQTRRYMGAVISSPVFEMGSTYHVFIGGELTGEEHEGVYAGSAIASYEGGAQQVYTGTDVTRFGGFGRGGFGGRGMGGMKDGFGGQRGERGNPGDMPADGERPQMPEGGFEMPEGMTPPEMPADGEMPELPEGFPMPEDDFNPFGAGALGEEGEPVADFYLQDKVNAYSGVKAQ